MPNHRRSKALCAVASALALAAFGGCGGDDDDAEDASSATTTEQAAPAQTAAETTPSGGGDVDKYKTDFQAAGEDFKDAAQASSEEVSSATDAAGRVQALEGLKGVVDDAADDFEALDAPAEVKPDNDKLVSQFRGVAKEVDAVRKALESNDQPAAQAAAQRLQKAQSAIGKTLASIESKVGG